MMQAGQQNAGEGDAVSNNPVLSRRLERQAAFLLAFALVGLIVPAVFLASSLVLGRMGGSLASTGYGLGRIFVLTLVLLLLCEPVILAVSLSLWRGGVRRGRNAFFAALATLLLWGGFIAYLVLRPR